MSIKQEFFDSILVGEKRVEYRNFQSKANEARFTRLDKATGKRYIRQPHILRLYTSYSADHDVLLVEVKKTVYREPYDIEYHLGKILEYDLKKTTAERVGINK